MTRWGRGVARAGTLRGWVITGALLLVPPACTDAPGMPADHGSRVAEHCADESSAFARHTAWLRQIDDCDPEQYGDTRYTPEDTWFSSLGRIGERDLVLVDTGRKCGWAGSCGRRVIAFSHERGRVRKDFEVCGFAESADRDSASFEFSTRGYASDALRWRARYHRGEVSAAPVARGPLPYDVLAQLPLADCEAPFDCYGLDAIRLDRDGDDLHVRVPGHLLAEDRPDTRDGEGRFTFTRATGREAQPGPASAGGPSLVRAWQLAQVANSSP